MSGLCETATPIRYPVETLTPREMTIVELLPTHLSYVQIGEQLFVSVNTVKSNLKSIYRKLAVSNRYEAVAAARQLGLIEPSVVG